VLGASAPDRVRRAWDPRIIHARPAVREISLAVGLPAARFHAFSTAARRDRGRPPTRSAGLRRMALAIGHGRGARGPVGGWADIGAIRQRALRGEPPARGCEDVRPSRARIRG